MIIQRDFSAGGYHVANNEPFLDERLSWEARGVLGYLFTKPEDWTPRMYDIVQNGPCKKHKIRSIFAELEEHQYLHRRKVRNDQGQFDWEVKIFDHPRSDPGWIESTLDAVHPGSDGGASKKDKQLTLNNTNKDGNKEECSTSADASDATPSGDGEVGSVGEAEEAVTPTVDGEPEDDGEERPPEERVEYEWTYKFSLAAMKHFRDHDLLAPVTEKKIEREGAEEVAVEWADTFRLMHEQDGYSPEEIASTMKWLFEGGNFWIRKSAIRSVPPLRSKTRSGDQYKFDSMYESAKQDHEQESESDLYQQIYEGWE